MTNVLNLTQFSAGSFQVPKNEDWNDALFFGTPGSTAKTQNLAASVTSGSNNVTVPSTTTVFPGMAIAQVPGIPAGAYVGVISSGTVFTMVDSSNVALNATITNPALNLILYPPPLDLTGIVFKASVSDQSGANTWLGLSTAGGTLINGTTSGIMAFAVPWTLLTPVPVGVYNMDVVAEGDGHVVNLFPSGPATVTVINGVTLP